MPDDLPPEAGERDWHWRDQAAEDEPLLPEAQRRSRLAVLVLTAAALAGVIIGAVFWLRVDPGGPELVQSLIVAEHDDPLYPSHAVALADEEAILQHFPNGQHGRQSQARDNLESEFRKLAKHKKGPVVVHLSCQARTHGGEVYLLPSDASPDRPATWLKLYDMLLHLTKCEVEEKLLLLDIAHPLVDTRLGLVYDDVAEGVRKTLDKLPPSSLLILCACGPGQTSLTSKSLGRSVFAHFVDQGLRGDADNWGPAAQEDKRVYAKELAAYVRHQTERWADINRGKKQTPWLWGQGPDFELVDRTVVKPPPAKGDDATKGDDKGGKDAKPAEKKEPADKGKGDEAKVDKKDSDKKETAEGKGKGEEAKPAEKKEPPPFPYPAKLKKAWELRDKVASHPKAKLTPAALLQYDLRLLNAEHNWGGRGEKDLGACLAELAKRDAGLDAVAPPRPYDELPPSLAIAVALDERTKSLALELRGALRTVTVDAPRNLKPDERKEQDGKEKAEKAGVQKELQKAIGAAKGLTELQGAAAVLEALRQEVNPNRLQTVLVHETIAALVAGRSPSEFVETVWLKRARDFDLFLRQPAKNQTQWVWPAATVGQSLRTLLAAEALAALLGREPDLLPWLDPVRLRTAEEDRRKGDRLLYWGNPDQWKDAADQLERAQRAYEALREDLIQVRDARIAYQRALVELPGHFLWLTARAEWNAEKDDAWKEAWENTQGLTDRLAVAAPRNVKDINGKFLTAALNTLAARRRERVAELTKNVQDQPASTLAALRALRAGGGLTAADRALLWQVEHELAEDRLGKFQPDAKPTRVAPTAPQRDELERGKQVDAAWLRAKLAMDLLSMANVPEETLKQLAADMAPPQDWEKVGLSLRKVWLWLRSPEAQVAANAPAEGFKYLLPVIGGDRPAPAVDVDLERKWSSACALWLSERYRGEAAFLDVSNQSGTGFTSAGSGFLKKTADRLKR
ncbi:MAG: hypothetical protein L0Y71_04830 [Gemmataceae bacterium]|nr:hypothetical protein [Gemmataceae bacterium]